MASQAQGLEEPARAPAHQVCKGAGAAVRRGAGERALEPLNDLAAWGVLEANLAAWDGGAVTITLACLQEGGKNRDAGLTAYGGEATGIKGKVSKSRRM